jgi:hypothetical protein
VGHAAPQHNERAEFDFIFTVERDCGATLKVQSIKRGGVEACSFCVGSETLKEPISL